MRSTKRNARRRNARRIAATTVASGLLAAGALALTTSAASASTLSAQGHGTAYSFRTLDNAKDLTFNQLLGINDSGVIAGYFGSGAARPPEQGLPAAAAVRAGQLHQRELPRLGPDPGHRPEQPRRHGRLLVHHEQRQHGQRQLRLRGRGRPLPQRRLPDRQPGQPAGRPAARRQRQRRRGGLLHRRQRQQPRLRVQHRVQPLQHGDRPQPARRQPDRGRHQRRGRRGRLLHQLGRHHRRVPQDAPRAVHRPGGSRRVCHHGAGRQRLR